VNYDEKQLTGGWGVGGGVRGKLLSCSFYLYRSYGFPIIIFLNPGIHYETPCIYFPKHLPLVHVARHEAKHDFPAKGPQEALWANYPFTLQKLNETGGRLCPHECDILC